MVNFWQDLSKPFLALAPMEDVTDFVFREVVADLPRPDVFFTEFVSVEGLMSKGRKRIIHKLKFSEKQRPIVAQIWGITPESFQESARLVSEMGFDGIDINMGCPERSVTKRGAGAGLIKNHDLVSKIIKAVRAGAPNLPVSVKTRLGFNSIVTQEWISFLLEQKLDALTGHGRIATQMSNGKANWEEIGNAVALKNKICPQTIVIGNGDIKSFSEALAMHQQYGVDGVMIGRGIFSNPWVFEKTTETRLHSKEENIAALLKHLKLYEETWGSGKHFEVMKKFFKMYIKDFDGANELRQKLMASKIGSEVIELLIEYK